MCKTLLIRRSSLVTFFSSLKFSICVCHFGVDLLIWPVTLFRENTEIILYLQNPVDPLIQPGNFFSSLKFSICVFHFGVDPLIHAPLLFHFLQNVAIFLNCGHDKLAMLLKLYHENRATVPNCVLGNRTMTICKHCPVPRTGF